MLVKDRAVLVSDEHKGLVYQLGVGTAVDPAKAAELYEVAAASDPVAAYNLATMYENGKGVARDYAKALAIYSECRSPAKTRRGPCRLGRDGSNGTQAFRQRLLDGPELGPCRGALAAAGRSCVLPCEALCFVRPAQWLTVQRALVDSDLKAYHVACTRGFTVSGVLHLTS